MRGTEALEGVGVPELMEGAGARGRPWGQRPPGSLGPGCSRRGENASTPLPCPPSPESTQAGTRVLGWVEGEDRTLLGLRGRVPATLQGAHRGVASPHARL